MAAKAFPKTLFAKIEKDGDSHYIVSDENYENLIAVGEKIKIGRYQLAEIMDAEGVVRLIAKK